MQAARRLLASQEPKGQKEFRGESERHGQPRPDHQREQHEDHEQIREALQNVIRPRFFLARPLKAQMSNQRTAKRLLSVDTPASQNNFSASLSAMDEESQNRFGQPFAALSGDQQNDLLFTASKEHVGNGKGQGKSPEARDSEGKHTEETRPSLNDHFNNLKGWISGAYYSSETGMTELGWTGEYAFENYPSCQHAEEHH